MNAKQRSKYKFPKGYVAQFDDSKKSRKNEAFKNRMRKLGKQQRTGVWRSDPRSGPVKQYRLSDKPLNYDEYLKGPYWLKLRKQILWTRNKCEDCGTTRRLNLHHLYYYKHGKSVLYRERQYTDIFAVLCYPCHMKVHNACSQAVLGTRLNQST